MTTPKTLGEVGGGGGRKEGGKAKPLATFPWYRRYIHACEWLELEVGSIDYGVALLPRGNEQFVRALGSHLSVMRLDVTPIPLSGRLGVWCP